MLSHTYNLIHSMMYTQNNYLFSVCITDTTTKIHTDPSMSPKPGNLVRLSKLLCLTSISVIFIALPMHTHTYTHSIYIYYVNPVLKRHTYASKYLSIDIMCL